MSLADHEPFASFFQIIFYPRPEATFELDRDKFLKNLRCSRRGAAAGPTGMTAEHLRPLLDFARDSELLWDLAQSFSSGEVPAEILPFLRLGRITALRKPSGGVRGIVVGDTFRRLVARTIAQQINPAVERATAPFQYAQTTRAGVECVAHVIQTLTDQDHATTVLSVDGVGAFDLISRASMLEGLRAMEGGDSVLPFVSQFYSSASTYNWVDDVGVVHDVVQGEGGEQGDPLMPALFALGQHRALVAVRERLLPDEHLLAFHDDVYIVCRPDRVVPIHALLRAQLWHHARIQIHQGKTQVWNRGGVEPANIQFLQQDALIADPDAVVWRGDEVLPTIDQGVVILGTPLGHFDFVQRHLQSKVESHRVLLERIPAVPDSQAAWLILLFYASARANFLLRALPPEATREFARQHDESLRMCLSELLSVTVDAWDIASLPLALGGVGLVSAQRGRHAASWASWGDCLEMVQKRHPDISEVVVRALRDLIPGVHVQGAAAARQVLVDVGFDAPQWAELAMGRRPPGWADDEDPITPKHGWQYRATQLVNAQFMEATVRPRLNGTSRALLRSQTGPLASVPFTCCPVTRQSSFDSQVFRVLLLRRLWLPLPCLPVWPSTRSQWPPPRSMCCGGGFG